MGSKNQTSTQTTKPPEYIEQAYQSLLGRAGQVANTPYDPNTERNVAGFAAPQTQAFGAVQNAQGIQSPYIGQTGNYIQSGASPISAQDISQYSNPYQQQVIDATLAELGRSNELQQDQLVGNAALKNALGNSRVGVAQAELARGQGANTANILAGLNQQNYNQALSAAQAEKARQFQAASQYGALGNQAQNAAYQDINALLGIGNQQQQQQQFGYDTATANAQQAAQYPFNTTQWLAGITQGLGSTAGGTTTTTTPGPSALSQIAGIGLTAASLFSDERVKEDVQPVGKTFDGQTVFKYRYQGDPRTQMGLLAQDVEQVHPEAVGSVGGIKTVNYDMATADAAGKGEFAGGGAVNPRSADILSRLHTATRGMDAIKKASGGRTEPQGIGRPTDMQETSPGNWEAPQGFAGGGFLDGWGMLPDLISNAAASGNVAAMSQPQGNRSLLESGLGGLGLKNVNMPMMNAGLGMIASQESNPFAAIAQGGLQGISAYRRGQRQNSDQKRSSSLFDNPFMMEEEPQQFADGGMSMYDRGMYRAPDALFDALLQQESGNRDIQGPLVTAGANAGDRAMGPAQIMPKTAADPGYGVAPMNMNAPDPVAENKRFGREYLDAMINAFGGDEEAALIAYNAGPGNAQKWLESGRDYSVLPQMGQTEPYAQNIMAMANGPQAASATPTAGIGAPTSILPPSVDPAETGIGAAQPVAQDAGSGEWEVNLPLLAAGLGILGSNSPFPGVAIGQGGMQGVQMLMKQRQTKREAQKLADAAKMAQERLGIQREGLDERKRHNLASEAQGSRAALSKNVIWGADAEGKPVVLQASPEGKLIRSELPEGVTPIRDTIRVDAGDRWILLDPVTRAKVGEEMKNVSEEERQKKVGQGLGEREVAKPEAKRSATTALSGLDRLSAEVDKLKGMSGLSSATGNLQGRSWMPNVWQSTADADASIRNIKGKVATTALQAMRDASKSGGAVGSVTEKEWPIIESMIANLDPLQGDELFVQRLNELQEYVRSAKERIAGAYQDTYGEGVTAPQAGGGGSTNDPLGIR